jgi:protein SCO1/2
MKLKTAAVLTALLGSSLPALSLAHDIAPFTVLSTTIDAQAKGRTVPDFSLQERSGKNITLADLRGKVWIADFVYTSCTDTCPFQTADMARLQDRWRDESDLRLVSFSVDPEHDTPKVLSRYANRFKADPSRWLFLTGNRAAVSHLVEDGFHLAVTPALKGTNNAGVILHSPRFVLIDRQGRIHGYYDNRDPKAMQRLHSDVAALVENK